MMMTPQHQNAPDRRLCLVDGSGFLFRAFHALPLLTRPDGTPVNAVLGFTNMLLKLLDDLQATHVAVIFDSARKSFRNEMFPEYKANRPDPPDELIPQFPLVRDATRAFNVACIERPGFEADDLIATYARHAQAEGLDVMIVSSDKDMMQLVSDRVSMFDALKNRRIGPAEVKEKFGVGPERVVDVQALAGDSTDNVPGVPGIGVKTAAQLIQAYGDLDSLLARASEIKQPKRRQSLIDFAEQARLSRELVRLRNDVPTDVTVPQLLRQDPDPAQLIAFLDEQGFRSLIAKIQSRLASGEAVTKTEKAPAATHYELVQSVEVLQDWVTRSRYAGAVAIDTETTSLDESLAELVGISLCVQPGHACYIPLAHRLPEPASEPDVSQSSGEHPPSLQREPVSQIPLDAALDLLRPLLADPSVLKIGHNLKYDMVVLRRYNVAISPMDDTMLMSYILDGGSHGHGMDELAALHLGHRTIAFKDVTGTGKSHITFDLVPLDQALAYAAEDADVTLRLHRFLKPRLLAERMVTPYETLERPLVPVLVDVETEGIHVDRATLERLSREFAERQRALETDIYRLAGREFGKFVPADFPARAPPNNWVRSCSTNCTWRAGTRGNPAPMPPAPTCWNRWPPKDTNCRPRCWNGDSSTNSRARIPMPWSNRSTRERVACTPPLPWPPRPPAVCLRRTPTCKTFPSGPKTVEKSATRSWPNPGGPCCRWTTPKSNSGSWPTWPVSTR